MTVRGREGQKSASSDICGSNKPNPDFMLVDDIRVPQRIELARERMLLCRLYLGLTLQLQFSPEMSFARIGLMGSAPRRPCEDIGVRDAPLGKLRGDTADFLDRPADQERRFGRDRSFVF